MQKFNYINKMEEEKNNRIDMHISKLSTADRSKAEVYLLLTYQGKLYLPPKSYANADFVSDVLIRDKKVRLRFSFFFILIGI